MEKTEKKYWDKVRKWRFLFRMVPFVKMVAVCNNLSFGIVDDCSDIDLFVVARRGRLYSARFFMNLLMRTFGVRVYGKKVSGRFCLSFFVDEDNLDMKKFAYEDDVYLAYWVYKLQPVIDRGVYGRFLDANVWALPIIEKKEFDGDLGAVKNCSGCGWSFGKLGDRFEAKIKKIQMARLAKKIDVLEDGKSVVVSDGVFKIHSDDMRKKFRDIFRSRVERGFDESEFLAILQRKKSL